MVDPLPPAWTGERVHVLDLPRVAVIGDIHGSAAPLERLLAMIDRPVLVAGDICDRGPDTRRCIEMLVKCGATGVLGNHDLWFAKWSSGHGFEQYALSPKMGGVATVASYGAETPDDWTKVPRSHADWVNALHLVIDLQVAGTPYWLMHAGIPSHRPIEGVSWAGLVHHFARYFPADLLWPPNDPHTMLPVGRTVIMGHVSQRAPLDTGEVCAIDTGAPRGMLTALLLPERKTLSV